ncbi:hypothetical protein C2G38_2117851 [Gigaspora rosea]|uniref:Uncharacterized protein n=1 Tax=Gigaspora rosea TaxID=44941 RepID=A0A397UA90_9GLOM|nr:hypothetical protein C2G38_2117851 [Gigaspora rosea]
MYYDQNTYSLPYSIHHTCCHKLLLILETVDPYFLLYFTFFCKIVSFHGIYYLIVMHSFLILENTDPYSSSFHIYIVFFLSLFFRNMWNLPHL